MTPAEIASRLRDPANIFSAVSILAPKESREAIEVPAKPGIYAWYFDEVPQKVPKDYTRVDGKALLYCGIAPGRPATAAKPSKQTLKRRIRTHLKDNASASTLRLSLGCLRGMPLEQTGSGRLTFGSGEDDLREWLSKHAWVSWVVHESPWTVEEDVIALLKTPLNLSNSAHGFCDSLSEIRDAARKKARTNAVLTRKKS